MRKYIAFILIGLFCCTSHKNNMVQDSEILWDKWGIPHIYANDRYEQYKLAGWAQMRNHADLILKLYGESRGRSAEYWGTGLKKDKLLHQLGLVEIGKKVYDNLSEEEQAVMIAFADGINAFANKYPCEISEKYKQILPVVPEDVLAHAFRVFYFEFLVNRALKKEKQFKAGSNAWAVSSKNTSDGQTFLLANPHLPWYDFWLFFECHYISKQNNLYGATLVGLPIIGIGFNEFLGWTHTVNIIDNVDFYQLETRDDKYKLEGKYLDFVVDTVHLKIKKQDKLSIERLIRKKTKHGIVLSETGNKITAIRFANMDKPLNFLKQWDKMGQAKNLKEFEEAIKINTLPLYNIVYADVKDNIMYHMGGQIPKKNGDWKKWQKPVSGNMSKDIWTEYYEYAQLPHLLNPESGWLQSSNDPPFTNTLPTVLSPKDYPSHMSPNLMSFRSQRSAKLLEQAPSKLSFDQFIELKHDINSELALRLKDDIKQLKNHTKDTHVLAALDVLIDWNGKFDKQSRGAALFINFIHALGGKSLDNMFSENWDFKHPIKTPDGFKNVKKTLAVLKKTAEKQMELFGSLEVPYGDLFRVKVGEHDYPASGGFGHLGLFRTISFKQRENGKFYAFHGDSFVFAATFSNNENEMVNAKALLTYGNATQSNSIHFGDQLELFSKGKLRDVWLDREEILSNIELKESISDM